MVHDHILMTGPPMAATLAHDQTKTEISKTYGTLVCIIIVLYLWYTENNLQNARHQAEHTSEAGSDEVRAVNTTFSLGVRSRRRGGGATAVGHDPCYASRTRECQGLFADLPCWMLVPPGPYAGPDRPGTSVQATLTGHFYRVLVEDDSVF